MKNCKAQKLTLLKSEYMLFSKYHDIHKLICIILFQHDKKQLDFNCFKDS